MISFLISALKIIVLLGFLVLIHEGGHFLAAKLFKIKVNEFAIGFGPTIFSKQKGETKYALHIVPLGGYVDMEGESEHSEDDRSFTKASLPKRAAIVLAGPIVNILFALIVYFIITAIAGNFYSTIVDYTLDDYAAKNYGIVSGDKIIEINDKRVNTKNDITNMLNESNGEKINVTIIRNEKEMTIGLLPTVIETKDIGILFNVSDDNFEPKIASVSKNSPAKLAGLKENDIILKVNNISVENDLYNVSKLIQESNGKVILTVQRQGKEIDIKVEPSIMKTYYLGAAFKEAEDTFSNNIYYGIIDTKEFFITILNNLKQLVTGQVSTNQMVGIIGISDIVVSTNGVNEYLYIMALISMSLGITNLLPIAPLDGGKLFVYVIEVIRRKPMKQETEMKLQYVGLSLLVALTIYVTYNDILRVF